MGVPQGSRVKVTLKIDPAKTDFDPTPVSRKATVASGATARNPVPSRPPRLALTRAGQH